MSTQQKAVLEALRNLYEAEGLKGLREMKKHHQEFISKCSFLEQEGDLQMRETEANLKQMKMVFGYFKRIQRESNWAKKREEKKTKPAGKRGRPVDQEKRNLKMKEKLLKRLLRVVQSNRKATSEALKGFKRNKREELAAKRKEEKASKPKGKPGRKPKVIEVVANTRDGEEVDLIQELLNQAEAAAME